MPKPTATGREFGHHHVAGDGSPPSIDFKDFSLLGRDISVVLEAKSRVFKGR